MKILETYIIEIILSDEAKKTLSKANNEKSIKSFKELTDQQKAAFSTNLLLNISMTRSWFWNGLD